MTLKEATDLFNASVFATENMYDAMSSLLAAYDDALSEIMTLKEELKEARAQCEGMHTHYQRRYEND